MTCQTPAQMQLSSNYYTAQLEGRGTPSDKKRGSLDHHPASHRVSCYPELALNLEEHQQLHSVKFIPVGNNGHASASTYLNINVYHRIMQGPNANKKSCNDSRVSLPAMGSAAGSVSHLIAILESINKDLVTGNMVRGDQPFVIDFKPRSHRDCFELQQMEFHRVFGAERGMLIKLISTGRTRPSFAANPVATEAIDGDIWIPLTHDQNNDADTAGMTLGQMIKVLKEMRKAMAATWRHRNNEEWRPAYDGLSDMPLPLVRTPRITQDQNGSQEEVQVVQQSSSLILADEKIRAAVQLLDEAHALRDGIADDQQDDIAVIADQLRDIAD